jgi:ribosomal protein S18 acetylase RimI-like enzyme
MTRESEAPRAGLERPRADGSDVRSLGGADVGRIATVLAQAFHDDPHMKWALRDEATRLRRLERAFAAYLRQVWLVRGRCLGHERLIGASLWMPPDAWRPGPLTQLRLLPAVVLTARGDLPRVLKGLTFMERKHPAEPVHWYLAVVGVAPSWQGRGFGAALLRPVLERADAERTPAYTEASSPRNRALYERHGFEVIEECTYAGDAPPLWRMWRKPAG